MSIFYSAKEYKIDSLNHLPLFGTRRHDIVFIFPLFFAVFFKYYYTKLVTKMTESFKLCSISIFCFYHIQKLSVGLFLPWFVFYPYPFRERERLWPECLPLTRTWALTSMWLKITNFRTGTLKQGSSISKNKTLLEVTKHQQICTHIPCATMCIKLYLTCRV